MWSAPCLIGPVMDNPFDEKNLKQQLQRAVALLSEHFDSVNINVTKTAEGHTIRCHGGCGDWYARYGATTEWLTLADNDMLSSAINNEDQE